MHRLSDSNGSHFGGPRLFTNASVRVILHTPCYTCQVKHKDQLLPGAYEPLVSDDLFQTIPAALKCNPSRGRTLEPRP